MEQGFCTLGISEQDELVESDGERRCLKASGHCHRRGTGEKAGGKERKTKFADEDYDVLYECVQAFCH
jgi:hypothetical protein